MARCKHTKGIITPYFSVLVIPLVKKTSAIIGGEGQNVSFFFFLCLKGESYMAENKFQESLVKDLEEMFPGSIVLKNDPNYIQGIPDLTILYKNKWAALEVKDSKDAPVRPNQPYYVDLLDGMSFSRFIYPENKEEVLDELQRALKPRRASRISKSK